MLETFSFSRDCEKGIFKFDTPAQTVRATSAWQDELIRRVCEHRLFCSQESTRYAQEYAKKKFAGYL
jgi:hypothetical protein